MEKSDINTLINTALSTENINYMNSEGMELFKKNLENKTKEDTALKIFLYFFPVNSSLEKNYKEFWFMKYKDVENYNEYKFAIDILQCYNQYLSDKNSEAFDYNILEKITLFKDYKFIVEFLGALKDYNSKIIAIFSYIEKDPSYFASAFEIIIEPEKIQKKSCINKIKDYLERKNALLKLQKSIEMIKIYSDLLEKEKASKTDLINDVNFLKKEVIGLKKDKATLNGSITKLQIDNATLNGSITKLQIDNATLNENITNLQNDNATLNENITNLQNDNEELKKNNMTLNKNISKMENDISELKDRLEQIDTRDTIKMSLRYLYKILFARFSGEMKRVTNIWEQIDEVKQILSKPEFIRFANVSKFIDYINWTGLNNLNEKAHDSSQKTRNFKGIEKYFKGISSLVTSYVANFFEELPNVNEFIRLNLLLYKDPKSVDAEFEKIQTYKDAYIAVFEKKKLK